MLKTSIDRLAARLQELETVLADPKVIADLDRYRQLSREFKRLTAARAQATELRTVEREIEEAEKLSSQADDPELARLASEERTRLGQRRQELKATLGATLLPRDPGLEKNCIVEIRAAAGGEEASLFAADLFRMYTRTIEHKGWALEVLSSRPTGLGGWREVIFSVEGDSPYRFLRFESGVHRVQRIPTTETAGRIHTSTVTVAVLPEAEEVDVKIDPADLRVEVFRASGHGGQHVNVTDSAVRITHIPTGVVASCQDERSQHRNRQKAMKILRARLLAAFEERKRAERTETRRSQVGTGERSEKIRTYNFPQNRVTDHRIGKSFHNLEAVLDGELTAVWNVLAETAQGAEC